MRCRNAKRWLSAAQDAELDPARERDLRRHLAECPQCQAFAADLSRFASMLDRWSASEPRPGFTQRTMARLEDQQSERLWLREWIEALRPLTAAAAAIALFCGIALAFAMNGESNGQSAASEDPVEAIYAASFKPVPTDSFGDGYLALLSVEEN